MSIAFGGFWKEILNSDAKHYGGSGHGNLGGVETTPVPSHGRFQSLSLVLPPLGIVFLKSEAAPKPEREAGGQEGIEAGEAGTLAE